MHFPSCLLALGEGAMIVGFGLTLSADYNPKPCAEHADGAAFPPLFAPRSAAARRALAPWPCRGGG